MTDRVSLGGQPPVAEEVVPSDAVGLPSKGLLYPPGHPFHAREVVEIRAMTAKDEDVLMSPALLKQGKTMDTLLRGCLIDKTVDIDSLLVGDKNAIVVALRVTGYGHSYPVDVQCPVCGDKKKTEFDLSHLELKPLGAPPIRPFENLFSFVVPVSKREVTFRLLTGRDDRELSTTLSRVAKSGALVTAGVTARLLQHVVSIAGETDRTKLSRLVETMSAGDSLALRKYIERLAPDVDMRQEFTCQSCNETSLADVPIGVEFFWPEA